MSVFGAGLERPYGETQRYFGDVRVHSTTHNIEYRKPVVPLYQALPEIGTSLWIELIIQSLKLCSLKL